MDFILMEPLEHIPYLGLRKRGDRIRDALTDYQDKVLESGHHSIPHMYDRDFNTSRFFYEILVAIAKARLEDPVD